MKTLDERDYHLSHFHRDLMESLTPHVAEGYAFLHQQLKDAEREVYERQLAIREFIRCHKLKREPNPKYVEAKRKRQEAMKAAPPAEPTQLELPGMRKDRIASLIAGINACKP